MAKEIVKFDKNCFNPNNMIFCFVNVIKVYSSAYRAIAFLGPN